jgi:hypothetical protein
MNLATLQQLQQQVQRQQAAASSKMLAISITFLQHQPPLLQLKALLLII